MKIAVRLDDITPDMDWQRFFRFKALLDQYQVKPLIGVVPDNRAAVKAERTHRRTFMLISEVFRKKAGLWLFMA